ncbi:hypothetical protein D5045_04200 [Verminephrobacter eiseniae]|nr:hypothetical protein [Verminephrobacter eiseniae]
MQRATTSSMRRLRHSPQRNRILRALRASSEGLRGPPPRGRAPAWFGQQGWLVVAAGCDRRRKGIAKAPQTRLADGHGPQRA